MPYIRDYNIWAIEQELDHPTAPDGSIILAMDQNGDTAYVLEPTGVVRAYTSDGQVMESDAFVMQFVYECLRDGILVLG